MRIIKQGSIKPKLARVTCGDCDTVFEFAREEGEYVSDHRDGDCVKIPCPCCYRVHWVNITLFRNKE